MEESVILQPIARVRTEFRSKFGIPRQSGLVPELSAVVVFEPDYRFPEAVRGLDGFSRIWLIWQFSENRDRGWSPTVRPPRLGGNRRMGVFATRSPFRPNGLGLSCVQLDRVETGGPDGPLLYISGADLLDGTPVFDIKPYVPYADAFPDARCGFAPPPSDMLEVDFPEPLLRLVPEDRRTALCRVLALDPRPRYQDDPERPYYLEFSTVAVRFTVREGTLHVLAVEPLPASGD